MKWNAKLKYPETGRVVKDCINVSSANMISSTLISDSRHSGSKQQVQASRPSTFVKVEECSPTFLVQPLFRVAAHITAVRLLPINHFTFLGEIPTPEVLVPNH